MAWINSRGNDEPGTYHVYNRGKDGRAVFRDDQDRRKFMEILSRYLTDSRFVEPSLGRSTRIAGIEHFAHCPMSTHYPLVLRQLVRGAISKLMNRVIRSYVGYFNARHGTSGALFSGPFRRVRITSAKQFKWAIAYVHDNHPSGPDYRWSSHRAYVDPDHCPPWLKADAALKVFGGRAEYLTYMSARAQRAGLNELFF